MSITISDPWIVHVFKTVDLADARAFAELFTEDGVFRFGNWEASYGRDGVEAAVGSFFSTIVALKHEITGTWTGSWEGGDVRSVEAYVTYTRLDGSRTDPLPVTSTLRLRGKEIQDYRVFMDVSPLYQTPEKGATS